MKTRFNVLLRYFVLLLALVFVSAGVILRVYATRVQHEAERLQADALTLIPGVTTLGEVRAFAGRTNRPEGYAGFDGPICDESQCVVSVGPMAFIDWDNPLLRLFAPFGVRPAGYNVVVEFAGGKVRKVVYGVFYKARRNVTLSGAVELVQRFSSEDLKGSTILVSHPAFAVCGGRGGQDRRLQSESIGIATDLTGERVHLNLTCVTSIFGCTDPSELFKANETITSASLRSGASRGCSDSTLAWSGNWPLGTYPRPD